MKQRMNNKNKKGSSLVFVIIAVAFVGILSTIILRVTLINVETKGTDRSIKKNFYSAEAVTDKYRIGKYFTGSHEKGICRFITKLCG